MNDEKFIVPKAVLKEYFNVDNIIDVKPYGNGHINETYLVVFPTIKYILQKINGTVFSSPFTVMHNIELVTNFIRKNVIYNGKDPRQCLLTIILNKYDQNLTIVNEEFWRCTRFIDECVTYDQTDDPEIFEEAGRAVGGFQKDLNHFKTRLIADTIDHFHDTPYRYQKFLDIVKIDRVNRVIQCQDEIEFVKKRSNKLDTIINLLKDGAIPRRVTHNDTKLNNIMISKTTRKALGLLDLDTVMKGSLLYDYGDALRIGASTAAEDEVDLSKVKINIELVRAFTRGYLSEVKGVITDEEIKHLIDGYYLMTFEVGMRFLTDYIDGDNYFKINDELKKTRPNINLERARNQLKLVSEIENQYDTLENIVKDILVELEYEVGKGE